MINQFRKLNLVTKRLVVILSFLLPLIFAAIAGISSGEAAAFVFILSFVFFWAIVFVVLFIRDGYKQEEDKVNTVI
jgi:hypothetical protein